MNEFRQFFGLKVHDTFEQINPDPEVADILRKLYDSPDMVELYPGLFIEDIKARMDPGSGIGIPYMQVVPSFPMLLVLSGGVDSSQ